MATPAMAEQEPLEMRLIPTAARAAWAAKVLLRGMAAMAEQAARAGLPTIHQKPAEMVEQAALPAPTAMAAMVVWAEMARMPLMPVAWESQVGTAARAARVVPSVAMAATAEQAAAAAMALLAMPIISMAAPVATVALVVSVALPLMGVPVYKALAAPAVMAARGMTVSMATPATGM
jgi:hypothetical protein